MATFMELRCTTEVLIILGVIENECYCQAFELLRLNSCMLTSPSYKPVISDRTAVADFDHAVAQLIGVYCCRVSNHICGKLPTV